MKKNRKNIVTVLISILVLFVIMMCTVFATDAIFNQYKAIDTSSYNISSHTLLKEPENPSKSNQDFGVDKATELISKYYEYKSVVEYDPNEFLSYAGFSSKGNIERNYETDNTSWVFWTHFQIELWNYFSFDLVVSDFAKYYEIAEFEGTKTVNYYGEKRSEVKTEYTILEVNSLRKLDDGYTCKAKISSNNGPISEVFEKEFKFIYFNRKYQLAEII